LGFPTGWSFNYTPPTFFWRNQLAIKLFSGAVAGEEVEDFCEGSFRTHIIYFVIVLLYFIYFTCIVLYQKPKKN
jgi:hypothetical protein